MSQLDRPLAKIQGRQQGGIKVLALYDLMVISITMLIE
jgi:hypothetical protein